MAKAYLINTNNNIRLIRRCH